MLFNVFKIIMVNKKFMMDVLKNSVNYLLYTCKG